MDKDIKYITSETAKHRARQLLVFLEALDADREEKLTERQIVSIFHTINDLVEYRWLYWMCKNLIGETDDEVVNRLQESENIVKADIEASNS
jgi:hypothetical protein